MQRFRLAALRHAEVPVIRENDIMKKNVLIIGGGPAGMMAACAAGEAGHRVTLLERNARTGRKLSITGNGSCNVTNAADPETLLDHVVTNRNFLYSALYSFSNEDMIRFLRDEGLETKIEDALRVFPVTDRAEDVVRVLESVMKRAGVRIRTGARVRRLLLDRRDPEAPVCKGAALEDGEQLSADVTILAAGGMSAPGTGSSGDGFRMAEEAGHRIRKPRPALTPFLMISSAMLS